ncbi:MAG: CIA30 family protein [Mariniphaga sp.]|nr:CIA30 family protein [Mariniphaga sp.]
MVTTLNSKVLFDFSKTRDTGNWLVVNDGVMGGLSKGDFVADENGKAVFSGTVSLENNGGFSSVQCKTGKIDVEGYSILELHLKGDGKKYQVRIRENSSDYYAFIYTFQTSGEWETIKIPLTEMYPSFRGRTLNLPNYSGKSMVELAFLIGNKKAEKFRLVLKKAVLK